MMKRTQVISAIAITVAALAYLAGRPGNGKGPSAADASPPPRTGTAPRTPRGIEVPSAGARATAAGESPQFLINRLAGLSVTEGSPRSARPLLVTLERLSNLGPKALPAIRHVLTHGEDTRYLPSGGRRLRDVKAMTRSLIPATLRIALFDLAAEAGGEEAGTLLSEALDTTRSGIELAYLSELLGPESHRQATVAAATRLLAGGDASDRPLLFELLRELGDHSYAATAQDQLVQPDGTIDRDALRYLQHALGPQSVALAARLYQDGRLSGAGSKEPLARTALTYVGSDPQALPLFHAALMDPTLYPDQKRELVEDLNQDGLVNRKSPTPGDLQVIANRYQLTQSYLQQDYVENDPTLNAAFREADKDLRKMLERAAAGPQP